MAFGILICNFIASKAAIRRGRDSSCWSRSQMSLECQMSLPRLAGQSGKLVRTCDGHEPQTGLSPVRGEADR